MSDASHERVLPDGTVFVDRVHLPLCPRCFQLVRRDQVQPRAGAGAFSRV
jgi:hypothetical protein